MAISGRAGVSGVQSGMSTNMPIDIDINPNPVIIVGQLNGLAASVRSFRKPLEKAIKEVVIPSITKTFAVEGRPEWDQLVEATIRSRENDGFPGEHPILIRTGRLYKAATAFARWTIGKDVAYVGNWPGYAWYGRLHQAGGGESDAFGSIGLPQRMFMAIYPEDQKAIDKVFERWVLERAAVAGFGGGML